MDSMYEECGELEKGDDAPSSELAPAGILKLRDCGVELSFAMDVLRVLCGMSMMLKLSAMAVSLYKSYLVFCREGCLSIL